MRKVHPLRACVVVACALAPWGGCAEEPGTETRTAEPPAPKTAMPAATGDTAGERPPPEVESPPPAPRWPALPGDLTVGAEDGAIVLARGGREGRLEVAKATDMVFTIVPLTVDESEHAVYVRLHGEAERGLLLRLRDGVEVLWKGNWPNTPTRRYEPRGAFDLWLRDLDADGRHELVVYSSYLTDFGIAHEVARVRRFDAAGGEFVEAPRPLVKRAPPQPPRMGERAYQALTRALGVAAVRIHSVHDLVSRTLPPSSESPIGRGLLRGEIDAGLEVAYTVLTGPDKDVPEGTMHLVVLRATGRHPEVLATLALGPGSMIDAKPPCDPRVNHRVGPRVAGWSLGVKALVATWKRDATTVVANAIRWHEGTLGPAAGEAVTIHECAGGPRRDVVLEIGTEEVAPRLHAEPIPEGAYRGW